MTAGLLSVGGVFVPLILWQEEGGIFYQRHGYATARGALETAHKVIGSMELEEKRGLDGTWRKWQGEAFGDRDVKLWTGEWRE